MAQADTSLKRKRATPNTDASRKKRHVSNHDARAISAQTKSKAFGNGGIDTEKFIRAREFEIKALGESVKRSKQHLNTRAFQHVPRDLRRRTASHNVKRVPKRLRARAAREMAEDNTPTVTAKTRSKALSTRARLKAASTVNTTATGKFRKRQIHKAWLPTHLFHAKRAQMTPPSKPLWRMAIPLTPSAKSYRPTHRATTLRSAVAWDTSYMSTVMLSGAQDAILEILSELSLDLDRSPQAQRLRQRWLAGSRYLERWYHKDGTAVAPLISVWQASEGSGSRSMILRLHPAAYEALWQTLLPLTKSRAVTLHDLRFEIGSIELQGPASAEVLSAVLRPRSAGPELAELWSLLPLVPNVSVLPSNVVIAGDVADPRLRASSSDKTQPATQEQEQQLLRILTQWPLDTQAAKSELFDQSARIKACRQLPSQKAVNRRKAAVLTGSAPPVLDTDPHIPIMILPGSSGGQRSSRQGYWSVLLPWRCVLPVWYCLMYQRISTGGTIKFGGLNEKRQTLFEAGLPWFPGDYPATPAGMAWEQRESEVRKEAWDRRPKGKRIEYDKIKLGNGEVGEIGEGWACAWDKVGSDLVTVRLDMLKGGKPSACARIYRLPTTDLGLRARWLSLLDREPSKAPISNRRKDCYILKDAPDHIRQRHLAATLLHGLETTAQHPPVPTSMDLIGFVTTGNFNLSDGIGTGIGSISLSAASTPVPDLDEMATKKQARLCIVRSAGEVTGRLARWTTVGSTDL